MPTGVCDGKFPTVIVMLPAAPPPGVRRLLEIFAAATPLLGGLQAGSALFGRQSVMSPSTVIWIFPPFPAPNRFSARIALPAFMIMSPVTVILIGQALSPDGDAGSLQRMLPPFAM